MKSISRFTIIALATLLVSCNGRDSDPPAAAADNANAKGGQEAVNDNESQKDVVKVAMGSKDHTTLVAALKQADLVTSLSNAGPLYCICPDQWCVQQTTCGNGWRPDEGWQEGWPSKHPPISCDFIGVESREFQWWAESWMVNGDNVSVSVKRW